MKVVGALLAKGADVEAKDNVSIARAWALYSSLMQECHGPGGHATASFEITLY